MVRRILTQKPLAEAKPHGTRDLKDDFHKTGARKQVRHFRTQCPRVTQSLEFWLWLVIILPKYSQYYYTSHNQKSVVLMKVKVSNISTSS